MLIKETLQRDPATHPLINQGQARIADQSDERTVQELRAELATFVCEGQYEDGLQRILSSYLGNLNHTSQQGAWVSGFYGSGKSHLLKMLCHLWQNTPFPDGSTARDLVPVLPSDIQAALKELDVAGKRGGGLFAAAGSLPSGDISRVRLTVLGIVLRSAGLPESWPQAQFTLWLMQEGHLDQVKSAVAAAGKVWESELNQLYVSPVIAKAVMSCDPQFAASEVKARETLKAQFAPPTGDITTAQLLETLKRVLRLQGRDGKIPRTVIVLDEVQQFIGSSTERSALVSEVAEAISKELDGAAIIVAAGQGALTETKELQRLLARFTIRVPLSDTDVEVVTRKVLLQKQPAAVKPIRELLARHAGEVSRQLAGTRIGEASEDHEVAVEDYPLLPIRRRFWEHCFRQIDLAGTSSQLRSQLRIIHDSVRKLSDRPIGAVVPADQLYEQLAPEMVSTGALPREINDRILNLGLAKGTLASRLCGLIFLISVLPREGGADIGVRANAAHLADLISDDLTTDNGKLRTEVANLLEQLVRNGELMEVGGEYRLQTREGMDWDQEFKQRRTRFNNTHSDVQHKQDQLLYAQFDRIVKGVKIMQGAAKEVRPFTIHRDDTPPKETGDSIPIWVRDQWSCSEKEHLDAARKAGLDSPVLFAFIPKRKPDQLREAIVDAEAAEQTLGMRGAPSTPEGEDARRSMESRRNLAVGLRDELIRQEVADAKVFQGGGSELLQVALGDKLKDGAEAALVRLYPNFAKADAPATAWATVIKRAREGADHPFQPVVDTGPTDQHPVAQQVMATIGAGKTGADVRRELKSAPFGWPQDAIDAALIALHRTQHLSAILNGTPVAAGALDQNRIPKAEFRREQVNLSAPDRIALRGLFQAVGVNCRSQEEASKAAEFVSAVSGMIAGAGGPAPFPPAPVVDGWDDVRSVAGNAQLKAILDLKDTLEAGIKLWGDRAELIQDREPEWTQALQLAEHAAHLAGAEEPLRQLDHVQAERLLLEQANPVEGIRTRLTDLLRTELNALHQHHEDAWKAATDQLKGNETWQRLEEPDRNRILTEVSLVRPSAPDVSGTRAILTTLNSRNLDTRRAEIDAVGTRGARALELAARHLEPRVQPVSVESATLRTDAEVRAWADRQVERLVEALKAGPVLVK